MTTAPRAPDDRPDEALVRAFLSRRDESSFLEIYRRHNPVLYRLAWRHGSGSTQEAGDLIQETWIRAVRLLPRFRRQSSLRTWLVGILMNVRRESWRADRRADAPLANAPPAKPVPTTAGPGPERVDLDRAIRALPDGYRSVVILHEIEGFTHREIGQILGLDEGTSKSQLARARKVLGARLQQSGKSP